MEGVEAVVTAAEEQLSPAILQVSNSPGLDIYTSANICLTSCALFFSLVPTTMSFKSKCRISLFKTTYWTLWLGSQITKDGFVSET